MEERINLIKEIVCEVYDITIEQMDTKSTERNISIPRQIAMAMSYTFTNLTQTQVGRFFQGRNHATINYSMNCLIDFYTVDKIYAGKIDSILYKLNHELGTAFTQEDIVNKLVNRDKIIITKRRSTHEEINRKVREIIEANNPDLILMLVTELKELHAIL
jgi:Bacterial dnaA protein helix-turn-helix